jgi:hypothetical protein
LYGVAGSGNISNNANPSQLDARTRTIERKARTSNNFIEEKQKYQDVRDKLRELKVLSDEGLISEKDYELKKKELLNEF